jgi:hypothetical protein
MPLYRVTWDDQDILDYTDERMVLLSPHLEMEINLAGSLRFVVPPYHTYYDLFTDQTMLISTVRVYEDEELIWFGRPLEMRTDFFKQKEIYCEGGLSYFNDSIHEHNKYDNVSLHDFFRKVVANHNYQVDSPRQFLVGDITVDDKVVYREPRYEKTIDVLRDQCLDTTDGYFFVRQENGKNYIDWLKDMPFNCNQVIEFAENMLDVSTSFDGNDYATCVMPLGANDDNGDPINIYDINNSDLLIISDMAKIYGRIVTVIQFSDIEDKYELLEEGRKALDRIQYNSRIIECSAADLHSKDGSKEIFKLGQLVHCYSEPHDLEIDLPLSKIELNLDTAAKNITLGIIKKKTLTRISRPKETESYQQEPYTPESYNPDPGVIEDPAGDEWEIIMPDENGDPVTAIRMPIKITIARDPNKTTYNPGEALDFTGLIVNIWTKDKNGNDSIWTKPPTYVDGVAPMSELSFSTRTAPNIESFSVMVNWKYKGKSYSTTLGLSTKDTAEFVPNVQAAGVEICHLEGGAYDRHFTTITGIPARVGCLFSSKSQSYAYLIVSTTADGCRVHCQDVRSPSYTRDLGSIGTVSINNITYYYGSGYGLYTSYGGHAISHIGPLITATNYEEAVRKLLAGG